MLGEETLRQCPKLLNVRKSRIRRAKVITIEIQQPELEALILERMKLGVFPTIEDALLQALNSSPLPSGQGSPMSSGTPGPTGADLVAAMQSLPYKEIGLEPARDRLPVRDVAF